MSPEGYSTKQWYSNVALQMSTMNNTALLMSVATIIDFVQCADIIARPVRVVPLDSNS